MPPEGRIETTVQKSTSDPSWRRPAIFASPPFVEIFLQGHAASGQHVQMDRTRAALRDASVQRRRCARGCGRILVAGETGGGSFSSNLGLSLER
jgi:hypothetical protein